AAMAMTVPTITSAVTPRTIATRLRALNQVTVPTRRWTALCKHAYSPKLSPSPSIDPVRVARRSAATKPIVALVLCRKQGRPGRGSFSRLSFKGRVRARLRRGRLLRGEHRGHRERPAQVERARRPRAVTASAPANEARARRRPCSQRDLPEQEARGAVRAAGDPRGRAHDRSPPRSRLGDP